MSKYPTLKKMIFIICLPFLTLCKSTKPSTIKHVVEKYKNEPSKFQWINVSRAEFVSSLSTEQKKIFNSTLVSRQWGQFWVDSIDRKLRESSPNQFVGVPNPQIYIVKSNEVNGTVDEKKVCFNQQIKLITDSAFQESGNFLRFDRGSKKVLNVSAFSNCSKIILPGEDLNKLIKWALGTQSGCSILKVHPEILFDCRRDLTQKGFKRVFEKGVIPVVSNWLSITSKVFTDLPRQEAIALISHELAHYYLAHAVSIFSTYGYFYRIGGKYEGRPPRHPNQAILRQKYSSLFAPEPVVITGLSGIFRFPETLLFTKSLLDKIEVNKCGDTEGCEVACKFVKDQMIDGRWEVRTNLVTWESLLNSNSGFSSVVSNEALKALQFYEYYAKHCFSRFKNSKRLTSFIKKKFPSFLSTSSKSTDSSEPLLTNRYVWDTLSKLASQKQKVINNFHKLRAKSLSDVHHSRLGLYTFEQEADELGAEFLAAVGITPSRLSDFFLSLLKNSEKKDRNWIGIGYDKCSNLRSSNWEAPKSIDFYHPPVGKWRDPHHSLCFRAFNSDQDSFRHHLPSSKFDVIEKPTFDEGTIEIIQLEKKE